MVFAAIRRSFAGTPRPVAAAASTPSTAQPVRGYQATDSFVSVTSGVDSRSPERRSAEMALALTRQALATPDTHGGFTVVAGAPGVGHDALLGYVRAAYWCSKDAADNNGTSTEALRLGLKVVGHAANRIISDIIAATDARDGAAMVTHGRRLAAFAAECSCDLFSMTEAALSPGSFLSALADLSGAHREEACSLQLELRNVADRAIATGRGLLPQSTQRVTA